MRAESAVIALAMLAGFAAIASADVIYLHCPTVFTKSLSTVKANYFKNFTVGGGPLPACNGLNVTIDGQPALNTWCVTNGLMAFNLSTPVAKTYTIEALSNPLDPNSPGDGTTANCTVRRSSFNVSITVPDVAPFLLPVIAVSALFLLRTRRRR